jgi:hypothetical protein
MAESARQSTRWRDPRRALACAASGLALLGATACSFEVDYGGTHYACGPREECAPGFECIDGYCSRAGMQDVDAAGGDPEAGGEDTADASPPQPPDAPPAADAGAPPPPDSGVPCTGGDAQTEHDGHCYFYVATPFEWSAARLFCQTQGAHLVTYASQDENNAVRGRLPITSDLWIGLDDRDDEGTFEWVTGEPLVFVNFESGQPSGNGDCVEQDGMTGQWNDTECNENQPFICEREP